LQGAQIGAGGLSPPSPLTLTTAPTRVNDKEFRHTTFNDLQVNCDVGVTDNQKRKSRNIDEFYFEGRDV